MATFENTQDIVSFMKANGLTTLSLVDKDKTRPTETGRFIATNNPDVKLVPAKDIDAIDKTMAVSWFTPEDGEPFWMLHKRSGNRETLDTFSI